MISFLKKTLKLKVDLVLIDVARGLVTIRFGFITVTTITPTIGIVASAIATAVTSTIRIVRLQKGKEIQFLNKSSKLLYLLNDLALNVIRRTN